MASIVWIWADNSSFYIQHPRGGNILIALGRVLGAFGAYFILIQLLLVGRVGLIEKNFGFDKLNNVHRFVGYCLAGFIILHPLLLVIGYAKLNQISLFGQLADFLANWRYVLLAYFGVLVFLFIIFISVSGIRKKLRYETWYFAHLFNYLALGLIFFHQFESGDFSKKPAIYFWYALNFAVFALVLSERLLRPLALFIKHRFKVLKVVQETENVYSLYVTGKSLESFKFQAGQFANITLLQKCIWFVHPFSFSMPPNSNFVRFSIKVLGDFTSRIKDVKPGTFLIIDGPLGLFIKDTALRDKYLFIAGGIGITPIRSILESLTETDKDSVLLYANQTEKNIVFKRELDELSGKSPKLKVIHVLGTPQSGYETGRVDKEKIVRLVPDFFEREVFVCGPPLMMDSVISDLKQLGFSRQNLHFEKFSF